MSLEASIEKSRREKERQLYASGLSQLAVIEREYGFIGIYAFPSLDAITAAGIAAALLNTKGLSTWIVVTPVLDEKFEDPSLIIGFDASIATRAEFGAPSIVVARGDKPQGLTRAAVVAHRDASLAGLVAGMLSETMAVGDRGLLALSMAYWLGLDRDKRGDFIGPEKWLAELLEVENRAEASLTLKLFDWHKLNTEDALASTLDPFYPGLSGDRDSVVKFLESDEKTANLVGVKLIDAPEEAVAALAEKLIEHLRGASRGRSRRPTEVIGIARVTARLPIEDLRKIPLALISWLEARGVLNTIPLVSSPSDYLGLANVLYEGVVEEIVASINRGYQTPKVIERREYGPIRVCIHRGLEEVAPLALVEKELRLLGVINDCILARDTGTSIEASLEWITECTTWDKLREAFRRGCLRYIDDTNRVELRQC